MYPVLEMSLNWNSFDNDRAAVLVDLKKWTAWISDSHFTPKPQIVTTNVLFPCSRVNIPVVPQEIGEHAGKAGSHLFLSTHVMHPCRLDY